jgi:hypothetical protein
MPECHAHIAAKLAVFIGGSVKQLTRVTMKVVKPFYRPAAILRNAANGALTLVK